MNLKQYLKTNHITRKDFAEMIEVKLSYLHNICQHPENVGGKTLQKIHIVTQGQVTREDMWGNKWPTKKTKASI